MSSLSQRLFLKDRSNGRNPVVAALDIGSSKVACMIARRGDTEGGMPLLAGAGFHSSRGVRAGAVTDLADLERSIRLAVEQAERDAEMRIDEVVVGVSGPDLRCEIVRAETQLGGREITAQHLREARNQAIARFRDSGREHLHISRMGYTVDNTSGVRDPRGMYAMKLVSSFLIVSAPATGLRNTLQCVTSAHLTPVAVVPSVYASGLATLVEDEAEQGVMLIDMGAGLTSAAAFHDNQLVHIDSLPFGGARATSDLAHGLGTTFAAAERIKTQFGAVGFSEADAIEEIEAPRLGMDGRLEKASCTRAGLSNYLRPRIEEIFVLMEERLTRASANGRPLPRRVVLTGGASQIASLRGLAEDIFRAPVRLAKPVNVRGLGETWSDPSFASCAGLLKHVMDGAKETARAGAERSGGEKLPGIVRRVSDWMQENF